MATLAIFTFLGAWNDFLWPLIVTSSDDMRTLPVGLALLARRNASDWGTTMAGTIITAAPLIIVFLLMQRRFIEGLTAGAVKDGCVSARPSEVSDPLLGEIGRQGSAIRGAAAALGQQVDAIRAIAHDRPDGRIVLTGMGSSLAAGHALVAALGRAGIPVDLVNAAELLHFGLPTLDARTTLVVVSQSGRSVEVVRIVEALGDVGARRPFVIGVTNGSANPLSDAADVTLDIAVGDELGPATMTFAATLVVLDALGRILLGRGRAAGPIVDEVMRAAGEGALAFDRLMADRPAMTDAVTGWAGGRRTLVIVGRGVGRAASDMASLTLKEVAGVAAESQVTADFRHGPLELVGPDLAIAFVCVEPETDAIDRAFAAELGRGPASVLVVDGSTDALAGVASIAIGPVSAPLAPAVAVVPFQLPRPGSGDRGGSLARGLPLRVEGHDHRMSGIVGRGRHYLVRDGRPFVPVGAHYVPVQGPDWPWRTDAASFDRAFAAMADAGLDTVRIDLLWSAIEPVEGGYDAAHLAVLDDVLEAARRHGLLLHPCLFVGGEVGDAYWDVPWRAGRHPHRDPDLVDAAVAPRARAGRSLARRPGDRRLGPRRRATALAVPGHDRRRGAGLDRRAMRRPPLGRPRPSDHDRHRQPGDRRRTVPSRCRRGPARRRDRPPLSDLRAGAVSG
jgi:glucosamine--fructose-6-phosphate aminotransferase (isomerizing)